MSETKISCYKEVSSGLKFLSIVQKKQNGSMIIPLHLIQTVYSLNVTYIYWVTRMKKKGNGLDPFLTEVSSMTPCQFNNLSSLCTAIFSEGRGRLYTRYNLSNSLKNTHQPNFHVNVQPKSRNRGEIFYYFGLDRSIISREGVQVFSFADHSSLATSQFNNRSRRS